MAISAKPQLLSFHVFTSLRTPITLLFPFYSYYVLFNNKKQRATEGQVFESNGFKYFRSHSLPETCWMLYIAGQKAAEMRESIKARISLAVRHAHQRVAFLLRSHINSSLTGSHKFYEYYTICELKVEMGKSFHV